MAAALSSSSSQQQQPMGAAGGGGRRWGNNHGNHHHHRRNDRPAGHHPGNRMPRPYHHHQQQQRDPRRMPQSEPTYNNNHHAAAASSARLPSSFTFDKNLAVQQRAAAASRASAYSSIVASEEKGPSIRNHHNNNRGGGYYDDSRNTAINHHTTTSNHHWGNNNNYPEDHQEASTNQRDYEDYSRWRDLDGPEGRRDMQDRQHVQQAPYNNNKDWRYIPGQDEVDTGPASLYNGNDWGRSGDRDFHQRENFERSHHHPPPPPPNSNGNNRRNFGNDDRPGWRRPPSFNDRNDNNNGSYHRPAGRWEGPNHQRNNGQPRASYQQQQQQQRPLANNNAPPFENRASSFGRTQNKHHHTGNSQYHAPQRSNRNNATMSNHNHGNTGAASAADPGRSIPISQTSRPHVNSNSVSKKPLPVDNKANAPRAASSFSQNATASNTTGRNNNATTAVPKTTTPAVASTTTATSAKNNDAPSPAPKPAQGIPLKWLKPSPSTTKPIPKKNGTTISGAIPRKTAGGGLTNMTIPRKSSSSASNVPPPSSPLNNNNTAVTDSEGGSTVSNQVPQRSTASSSAGPQQQRQVPSLLKINISKTKEVTDSSPAMTPEAGNGDNGGFFFKKSNAKVIEQRKIPDSATAPITFKAKDHDDSAADHCLISMDSPDLHDEEEDDDHPVSVTNRNNKRITTVLEEEDESDDDVELFDDDDDSGVDTSDGESCGDFGSSSSDEEESDSEEEQRPSPSRVLKLKIRVPKEMRASPPTGAPQPIQAPTEAEQQPKKKRGRKKGSKNRPKKAAEDVQNDSDNIIPVKKVKGKPGRKKKRRGEPSPEEIEKDRLAFEEERRKREAARPLTAEEIKAILGEDDGPVGECDNWVRRSSRRATHPILESKEMKGFVEKLKRNDPEMKVCKMKKYIPDPDAPTSVLDAALNALEDNSNVEALYIQNFNQGMRDDQVIHLLKILQQPKCKIWCLNIGETYNVSSKTWAKFTKGLKKTKITHMYASEHTITNEMKNKIRETIRKNRDKHDMHINPNNLDVIIQCTHCWWNPMNAKVLRPYLKKKGYEHILNDAQTQGLRGTMSDAPTS